MMSKQSKHILKYLLGIIASVFVSLACAEPKSLPLPAHEAFKLSAEYVQPGLLMLRWQIAPKYYLYRDKINIYLMTDRSVQLGPLVLPNGIFKQDAVHGRYEAYAGGLIIPVPLLNEKMGTVNLAIGYQGCSENGFCYPMINKLLKIDLSHVTAPQDLTLDIVPMPKVVSNALPTSKQAQMPKVVSNALPTSKQAQMPKVVSNALPTSKQAQMPKVVSNALPISKQAQIEGIFYGRSFFFIILSFMGLGLLLAFTPCVLPMVPILSGIIVGHGKHLGIRRTFLLSLSYVLGMAMTYAVAGIGVAMLGSHLQTQLQRPWVIVMFSGIFVLLALSLFGLYELQMPNGWQRRITAWSHRQKGGSYFSVFIMGSISSLIVSPCVSPPLIGVLSYIADSGNMVLGALALLALGIGMGLPLLLVGLSAGHILPKAGAWMGVIEKLMGITMLAFAIWMLSRVIPGYITLFLWSMLSIISSVFLGLLTPATNDFNRLCRGFSLVLLVYGIILMMGAALGNADALHPWENWKVISSSAMLPDNNKTTFLVIKNREQLDSLLAKAVAEKKGVLLDFYAEWCASCVKMDKEVFNTEAVKNSLSNRMLLRADVTTNDDFSQAMLNRFHVVAPPTILFFNQDGKELTADRLIGEISAAELIDHIKKIQE
jgi:thioredoxin:protein disulfide reductase